MGDEWSNQRLADVVELIGGGTPKRNHSDYWGGDIPWLSVRDFNNDNRYVYSTEETITEEGVKNSSTKILSPGQIIISARGTVGALAQLVRPMAFNQSCYGINAKDGTFNDYLFYLLKHTVANLQRITHGAVFDTITRETFQHVEIALPSLPEQRAIAHILGSLDDKIELNRQMAQTLESIARAIFKSWFVDFDPVKAKMEGKQPEGMTEEIAALFPDRLVDSELGMIPEGGEVLKFPEEFDFTMGQSPPGSSYNEYFNGVPFYQGSADFGQWYPTERIYCTAPTRFANKGDVLFSVRAPVGDMNIALSDCAIGRGLCCIRHKSGSTALTYLYLTNTKSVMEHNAGEGAVFKSLSKKQLTMLPVVSIPDVIAKSFIKIVDPIFEKIQSLEDNARTLCSLRDTLLPRLISGKIRLKQPEDAAA